MIKKYIVKYGYSHQLTYNQSHELIEVDVWTKGYYATYRQITMIFIESEVKNHIGEEHFQYYEDEPFYLALILFEQLHPPYYEEPQ